MHILFQRSQNAGSWKRILFKLHAKLDTSEDEQAIINKYNFQNAVLIDSDQPGLIRNSIFVGLFSFFALYIFFTFNLSSMIGLRLGWVSTLAVAAITAMLCAFIFYHQKRETIYVKDLLYGRYFRCRSICELARKEAYLETIAGYLRQVMESAIHWDGVEKFEILPLPKEEAKALILKGPLF